MKRFARLQRAHARKVEGVLRSLREARVIFGGMDIPLENRFIFITKEIYISLSGTQESWDAIPLDEGES